LRTCCASGSSRLPVRPDTPSAAATSRATSFVLFVLFVLFVVKSLPKRAPTTNDTKTTNGNHDTTKSARLSMSASKPATDRHLKTSHGCALILYLNPRSRRKLARPECSPECSPDPWPDRRSFQGRCTACR